MRQVSITDIAQAAGVSPSTVSRALQDHPRISLERRKAIQALAREMGYRPSQVARSLVTGHTRTLGVAVTDVTDPFVAEVMKGAEAASRKADYGLLFAMSNRDPSQEVAAAQILLDHQVDGMVVISSRANARYNEMLSGRGPKHGSQIPLVLVNNAQPGPNVFSVRMDNRDGACQAVTYLRELGHRRIAFVAGPEGGCSSRERLEGYRQGMAENGLRPDLKLIVTGGGLLEDGLCYNDLAAIGLPAAAAAAGLHIPDDLSVIGYDNIPLSRFTIPPLTTVDQPKETLGRLAVMMCICALNGEPVKDAVLTGELIVRGSTNLHSKEKGPT